MKYRVSRAGSVYKVKSKKKSRKKTYGSIKSARNAAKRGRSKSHYSNH